MEPLFFEKQSDFRKWLEENHKTASELLVGFHKVNSGKPSMSWSESVDEALCFGWIDGVRKSIDQNSYCIRFSPRKPSSIWSRVNIRKAEALIQRGMMQPSGLQLYQERREGKTGIYSFENDVKELTAAFEAKFKANQRAWDFFAAQAPSYKKTIIHWIMSAKQEATRYSRLEKVIEASEAGKRLR